MPEILQYSFFQNALLSSILVGVLGGFIGTYIVTRRLVFIAGGLAHASLGGVGICVLLGISPLAGAAGFTLLSALGMDKLRRRLSVREDAAVAMLWAFGMSLGVMCVFLSPSFLPDLPNYIFGNILLSTSEDLIFLTVVTALTVLFFFRFMRYITAIAFDSDFARSQHLPVDRIEMALTILMALSVVAILRTMGIVLAISLLSLPQITACVFVRKFNHIVVGAMLFTVIDCLVGLVVSYFINVPSGASIVFSSVVVYVICKAIKESCMRYKKIQVSGR